MKICQYCGTQNQNSAEKCVSCRATEFRYICANCGKEFEDAAYCPACGVKAGSSPKTCPRCGATYFTKACPECGYVPEIGAQKTVIEHRYVQEAPAKKKASCWVVLLWILFLPVMAIIAIWRAKKLPTVLKIIFTVVISFLMLISFLASNSDSEAQTKDNGLASPSSAVSSETPADKKPAPSRKAAAAPEAKELTYGDAFDFDNLEITFSPDVAYTTLDNQFSEADGKAVIVFPVTITNNSGDTHGLNMFYFTFYSPSGTKAENVGAYFMDDDAQFAGDMRDGATLTTAFHILYDGDGDYYVEFSNFSDKIEIKLPIAK